MIDAPWVRERGVELDGLEWAEAGEDDFDALPFVNTQNPAYAALRSSRE